MYEPAIRIAADDAHVLREIADTCCGAERGDRPDAREWAA
jgi:hypothetical protein